MDTPRRVWHCLKCRIIQPGISILKTLWSALQEECRISLSAARAHLVSAEDTIKLRWDAPVPSRSEKMAAVFCHYDESSSVSEETLNYVKAVTNAGFAVSFVTSSPDLTDVALERLKTICAVVVHRKNIGYDFGCYREGLRTLEPISRFEKILLANDSVLGPFTDLTSLIERCDERADVWGMTDSVESVHHLQSYFLLFNQRSILSAAFREFWSRYPLVNYKPAVIKLGELGLAKALTRGGLKLRALFPIEALAIAFEARCERLHILPAAPTRHSPLGEAEVLYLLRRGAPLNPTHFYWRELLEAGCPTIKRELVLRNPMNLANVSDWRSQLEASIAGSTERSDSRA